MRTMFSTTCVCLFASLLSLLSVGPASAQWAGFYGGFHVGGGAGVHDTTLLTDIVILPPNARVDQRQSGLVGGGHVGFNHVMGPWLLGLEGTFSWTSIDGRGRRNSEALPGFTVHTEGEANWIASAVARIGYASSRSILYAKGGVAMTSFDMRGYSTYLGDYLGGGSFSDRSTGWTVGLGAEFALSNGWSVRLDYDYYDFGKERASPYRERRSRSKSTSTSHAPD